MRVTNVLRVGAFGLFLGACGVLTDAGPRPTAAPCPSEVPEQDIELRPVKEVFAAGEPIELRVVVHNRTELPLDLFCDCPLLTLEGGPAPLPPPPDDLEDRPIWVWRMRIPIFMVWLEPGGRHWGTTYVQSFVHSPGLGDHCIRYHASLEGSSADPTLESDWGRGVSVHVPLRGAGGLKFAVRPAAPGELERVAAQYAARLNGRDGGPLHALALMEDRFVLPYLPRLATRAYYRDEKCAIRRRFAHNEAARALLRRALADANERDAVVLLDTLTEWKCDVDVELLRRLFRSSDVRLRSAVECYAREMDKPQYDAFLPHPHDGPA